MPEEFENHLVWTPTYEYVAHKMREKKRLDLIIAPYIKREALYILERPIVL